MKLTQKKCNIMLPKIKSANALQLLVSFVVHCSLHSCCKCWHVPLVRNALELDLVLRVGLHAQADCEDELTNCC